MYTVSLESCAKTKKQHFGKNNFEQQFFIWGFLEKKSSLKISQVRLNLANIETQKCEQSIVNVLYLINFQI